MGKMSSRSSNIKGHSGKKLVAFCVLSLAAHAALFGGVVWLQAFEFVPPEPTVVRVDLVSFAPGPEAKEVLPEGPPAALEKTPLPPEPEPQHINLNPEPAVPPEVKPSVKPSPVPVAVLAPDVSLKKKPENIKKIIAERKARTQKIAKQATPKPQNHPEKTLEQARQALARKVQAQSQRQIDQALQRMKKTVERQHRGGRQDGQGAGMGQGDRIATLKEVYKMQIAHALRRNWIYNETLAGMNPDLEARVFIKILKSGEIRDISYETRSGNRYLDESVKKAIKRSNPMPELPDGMNSYELVLIFNPRGIK